MKAETKKQIENLIKASELYETIEVIQDCLSHFEELDYLQKYNLKIPDIKKSLSQDCQCEDDCFCPSIFLDTVDGSGEIELSDYARSLVGVVDFDQRFEEGEMSDFLKLIEKCEYVELRILFHLPSDEIPKKNLYKGLEYLKSICKIDEIKLQVNKNPYSGPDLNFTKLIESSKFIGPDPIDSLPANLITKFKEFAKKNNLSLSGKKELVNLLSRAP